ncbi:MAG: retron system putative HNH endonuclease [Porphyromonadaceae bacterium]|nr:retron system putative HNH endonuclease [Porphyromonadaceae bacterium]
MRKINKRQPHEEFIKFKKNNPKQWSEFSNATINNGEKLSTFIRKYILDTEQGGLGGYTEIPLTLDQSHIGHFRKRECYPKLTFCWENMIVDQKDITEYGAGAKDNQINLDNCENYYHRIIDPTQEDPHQYFDYSLSGEIIPKYGLNDELKEKAMTTIEVFNLNHHKLISRRNELGKGVISITKEIKDKEKIKECFCSRGFPSFLEFIIENQRYITESYKGVI